MSFGENGFWRNVPVSPSAQSGKIWNKNQIGYSLFLSYFLKDVPLGQYDGLHQDAEEEEESLVHGRQVDPGVEGDQEDELHQQGGVDEDVGQACAHPDCHAGGVTSLQSIGEPQWGTKQ